MVSHDPKQPQPTNVPPTPIEPASLAPRPPNSVPQWISNVMPKLDLVIEDILCPGSARFLELVKPAALLQDAVVGVLLELYDKKTVPSQVKCLRLVIKESDGVAATFGNQTEKTIVFNAKYIANVGQRAKDEILGVIRHEVVHCFQHDGQGTAPIGLIEGVADFVRLRADMAPPHWKRGERGGGRWDAGYEKTAFFLDWLEQTIGEGTVRRLNMELTVEYHEKKFWKRVADTTVQELWERYSTSS